MSKPVPQNLDKPRATRDVARDTVRAQTRKPRRTFGRLRKLPSGRWQAAYVHDEKVYTAPHTFAAKIDAEGWLAERRREIDRDLWSAPATVDEKRAKRERELTFGEYAKTWLDTRLVKGRPLRPRTRDHYSRLLDKYLVPAFGKKPLRSIDRAMVERWYSKTADEPPTLRAHCYSLLRTIMESARTDRRRLIDINPCAIAGAGTTDRKIQPKPATVDQLDTLAAEMPENLKAMVLLASWCALRFGELVELRRRDIDVADKLVNVQRAAVRVDGGWSVGDPKSDAGKRVVAIPPHVWPQVKRHLAVHVEPAANALLFPPKNGEHLQPSTLYRHFYRAREKAGRPDLRWHDLRHSGATLAAQTGATLAELMARLGHSTPQAAMRYQHAAAGRDQVIADELSKLAAAAKKVAAAKKAAERKVAKKAVPTKVTEK